MPRITGRAVLEAVPNAIGIARLICAPLIFLLMINRDFQLALWIYLIAGLSDAVDGFLARRLGVAGRPLGRILDPIADKLLVNASFIAAYFHDWLPFWFIILVLARDIMILAAFLLSRLLRHSVPVAPLLLSKINTALQITLGTLVLLEPAYGWPVAPYVGSILYAIVATTIVSAAMYFTDWFLSLWRFRRVLK